ncbi:MULTISPECIES: hypothetical protein [Clostridium]|uniref:rRNA biogenesis protein rrp5 n=1 Tax=Clostridium frigoriphilum TaxID=443253 RepID=A0ABU7USA3_9CLOT|nr:hypothetical protein [Clostridium sp. DSM 17811]MBU3100692.1 hypothetical protein [Clostridium sp. DSM 17811]
MNNDLIIKGLEMIIVGLREDLVEVVKGKALHIESTKPKVETFTLEKVRGVLASKSQNGKQPEVKSLITKYGGKKLTDIDPACYKDLLKEAEGL